MVRVSFEYRYPIGRRDEQTSIAKRIDSAALSNSDKQRNFRAQTAREMEKRLGTGACVRSKEGVAFQRRYAGVTPGPIAAVQLATVA